MKRAIYTILVTALLCSEATLAASVETGQDQFGFKGGLSLGSASGDGLITGAGNARTSRTAVAGGISFGLAVGKTLVIQPELMLVEKGANYADPLIRAKADISLDYLEIPVLVAVNPAVKGNVRPTFFGGPFIGFLMSAKSRSQGYFWPPDGEHDIKDYAESTELGLAVGTGLRWIQPSGELSLEIRYDLGLTNVVNSTFKYLGVDASTRTVLLLVGYRFGI